MTVAPETTGPLNDAWPAIAYSFVPDIDDWIVAGDHIVVSADRALYALTMYGGTAVPALPGGFPHHLQAPSGATNLAYGNGVVYFTDGNAVGALTLPQGTPVPNWNGGSYTGVASLQVVGGVLVVVYAGSGAQSTIAGLSPADGSVLWGPNAVAAGSPGLVGLADGAVYFVAGTALTAVNVASGKVRFSQAPSDAGASLDQSNPPLCVGTTVICGGSGVYAFDYRTGVQRWSSLEGSGNWIVAPADDTYVLASGGTGAIAKVAVADGSTEPPATSSATSLTPWTQPVNAPGTPFAIGSTVFALGDNNATLYTFDRTGGAPIESFPLGSLPALTAPLIGGGYLWVPTTDGMLHALPFAPQNAAFFDGNAAYFEITPKNGDFNFGTDDFSVELWVRTSTGGDVLTSYPATPGHYGFRFNVDADGTLGFFIGDAVQNDIDLWITGLTAAADGTWHHLAAVRRNGEVAIYLDAVQQQAARSYRRGGRKVNPAYLEQRPLCAPLSILGGNALVGGASKLNAASHPLHRLTGSMREVRVWKRALPADRIASRRFMRLTFLTSDLLGNWHLDHDWSQGAPSQQQLENDVQGFDFAGTFANAFSYVSDFASDDSAYPFFLEKKALPWPYNSSAHWAVCGEDQIRTAPVLASGGIVCFADDIAIYGVEKLSGKRRWLVEMPEGCSQPVADGDRFLALTWGLGLIAIDAETGRFDMPDGFGGMIPAGASRSVPLAAPAATPDLIAAAGPDGKLWIRTRSATTATVLATAAGPENVQIAGGYVAVFAGGTIFVADANAGKIVATIANAEPGYSLDAQRLVCVSGGTFAIFDAASGFATSVAGVASPPAGITGVAASSDANLFVATTSGGMVYGYSLGNLATRWTYAHPSGTGLGSVFAPSVAQGNVALTTSSGTVLMIDGANGESLAELQEAHAAATPPLADRGTLYYGCVAEGADGLKDGALHSVALGETYALRLGAVPGAATRGHVAVTTTQAFAPTIPGEACIEAWINTEAGGEIFSLLPTQDAATTYARLAVGADGAFAFEFAARASGTAAWQSTSCRTIATRAAEGKWHHVAVSVNGAADVRLYLDGAPQTLTTAALASVPAAAKGGRAFIGAGIPDANGAPTAFCTGMIAEVRLWDVYLVADEISARMHTKLRGNEPDLQAYWNFDSRSAHDASRQGYDGTVAGEGSDADYWLTDLTFDRPTYPFLTTAAKITSIAGQPTTYALTLQAFAADLTPLATNLDVWYVAGDKQPSSIKVGSASGMQPLAAVAPAHEGDPNTSYSTATDKSGSVTVMIETSDPTIGPSLDVRAAYMYPNERYHVSVLIDNQTLSRPGQPSLTAQTKLMEDYGYVHGDSVAAANREHTFQVILTVHGADGSAIPNEAVNVWCDETLAVESGGVAYAVSPSDSASLSTNELGQVTVKIVTTDIKCPELSVWAGFMQRDARFKVAPDQDVRSGLSTVSGDQLNATKQLGRNDDGTVATGSVLSGDYTTHSDTISQTMRHLMAGTQSHDSPHGVQTLRAMRASRPLLAQRPLRGPFDDMTQLPPWSKSDVVRTNRTMLHIDRRTPVTPEFVRASLRAVDPTAIGFVFSCRNGDLSTLTFTLAHSEEELQNAMAGLGGGVTLAAHHELAMLRLGSIWSKIKDWADDAWDEVKALAVRVADTVTAAVSKAEGWLTVAIEDVKTALLAVGNFLVQLALEVVKIIELILSFFDWEEILAIAALLKGYVNQICGQAASAIDALDLPGKVQPIITALKGIEADLSGASPVIDTIAAARQRFQSGQSAGVDSVQGKYAHGKVAQYGPQATYEAAVSTGGTEIAIAEDVVSGMGKALSDFLLAVPDITSMSLSDFVTMLKRLAGDVLDPVIDQITDALQALTQNASAIVRGALDGITGAIHVPFLSELYHWLTGKDLTHVDLASFAIAIPMNISTELLYQRKFTDVAPGALPQLFSFDGQGPRRAAFVRARALSADDSSSAQSGNTQVYVTTGALLGIAQAAVDLAKMARLAEAAGDSAAPPSAIEVIAQCILSTLSIVNTISSADIESEIMMARVITQSLILVVYVSKLGTGRVSIDFLDKLSPVASTFIGAFTIGKTLHDVSLDDAHKAELVFWTLPDLYR
ncbi:MAG TPA: LamG-like jellyroll fold domain-containing protein, partial [Candidatus Elarobacter sp.]